MPTLLISLGTSPAIVPEAFLLPGVDFDTVHVLTTDSKNVGTDFVEEWFAQQAPAVHLTITRVAGYGRGRSFPLRRGALPVVVGDLTPGRRQAWRLSL